jgi:purine catabolism regulator
MLTIREALEMPVLAPASVVAGRSGLDNQIRWVHIVDIPDAHYEWQRSGVLLLTAGYGLRDQPERQATLVPKLVEEGFAGMILSVGHYFDATPEIILQEADALGFPVVETPPDLLFIEVTEVILENIINRQYQLLQQSNQIHAEMTDLVLRGGDLDDLASTLSDYLQRSITIEDPSFHVLAAAQHGAVDEARRRSVSEGRTTPQVAQRLLDDGIYDRLLSSMAPLRVAPMPDLGMQMERIVAPIIVDREIHGYIWIIAGDHPLADLDELAISRAATVAALIMFKEQSVRQAEESLRGDFFEQLLKGNLNSSAFLEQASRFDFSLDLPHQILVIHASLKAGGNAGSLHQSVQIWLRDREARALLVPRHEDLILLFESTGATGAEELAENLVADLSHPACRLLVGVGNAFEAEGDQDTSIRDSYEGAREAIQIGLAFGQHEGVLSFRDLGILHWLYHLPPEVRTENKYLSYLDDLVAYDAGHNTELLKTVEVYLDHGASLIDAAEALYIHRNTLIHRLDRIQALTDLDLRDPTHRLNLHVATKSYRLHSKK